MASTVGRAATALRSWRSQRDFVLLLIFVPSAVTVTEAWHAGRVRSGVLILQNLNSMWWDGDHALFADV